VKMTNYMSDLVLNILSLFDVRLIFVQCTVKSLLKFFVHLRRSGHMPIAHFRRSATARPLSMLQNGITVGITVVQLKRRWPVM